MKAAWAHAHRQDLTIVSVGYVQITNLSEQDHVGESEGVNLNKAVITEGLKNYIEEFWQKKIIKETNKTSSFLRLLWQCDMDEGLEALRQGRERGIS